MRRSSNSSSWLRFGRVLLQLWLCLGALARPAFADEPSAEWVSKGLLLRRERRDAEALQLFQRAYSAAAKPMILAQIALAEQALGRWPSAERDLTSALATHDAWIEANREALEKALLIIQAHLCWLLVTSNVESAELWLDTQHLGRVPAAPFRVAEGTYELSLRLADGRSSTRSVQLAATEREHFHVEFTEPPPAAAECPVPPPVVAPKPAKIPASSPVHASSTRQSLAFATATLSAFALAGAVTASLIRVDYIERYNSAACAPDRSKQCAPYRDIAGTLGNVAIAGYVVAGAAGLGSVALFTAPYWYPSAGRGGAQAGFTLSGKF